MENLYNINVSNLQKDKLSTAELLADLAALTLLGLNLLLILFDFIFEAVLIQDILRNYLYDFYFYYNEYIHQNFSLIDLIFISIFVSELFIRWGIAIFRKTYHKWFFYPFVHWYDTLGCLPGAAFRFLRLLRIFMMLYKLQKMGVVDLRYTYVYKTITKYFAIFVEEVSDRVVINVLNEVQNEIEKGNPLTEKILAQVVKPHSGTLAAWLSRRLQKVVAANHDSYKNDLKRYVDKLIYEAVEQNREIKAIEQMIPVLGGFISQTLEHAISDIVHNVVQQILKDIVKPENNYVIDEICEVVIATLVLDEQGHKQLSTLSKGMLIESIELIKKQVSLQQWKLKELEEKEMGFSFPRES
jgi:hypothetical protein